MLTLVLSLASLAISGELFEKPFRVQDAQGWIDVDRGMAAPLVTDFDGDGLPDLLVGQFGEGKLRIYKNVGTAKAPRFEGFRWFKTGEQEGKVPVGWCVGFGPQFADLDGDGIKDVLSGSDTRGDVYLFRGLGGGAYAAGVKLPSSDGRPARAGSASAVSVADWTGDGRLDLVVGNREGKVALLPGLGNKEGLPAFGAPEKFVLEEADPVPDSGDAGPLVVDWDRDGVDDLLVGYGWGPVVFYKGVIESNGTHSVLGGEILLQPCYEDEPESLARSELTGKPEPVVGRSHKLPKLAVFDWNGDGKLDLLVGDIFSTSGPEPVLSSEQRQQRDGLLQREHEQFEKLYAARRPLQDQAEKDVGPQEKYRGRLGDWQEAVETRKAELVGKSETCQALERAIADIQRQLAPLRVAHIAHGYVWVYLRR